MFALTMNPVSFARKSCDHLQDREASSSSNHQLTQDRQQVFAELGPLFHPATVRRSDDQLFLVDQTLPDPR